MCKINIFARNSFNYSPIRHIFAGRIKNITMKEKIITTKIIECGMDELTPEDQELVKAAKEMTRVSFAPYSQFHVGAAIRMENGDIIRGSNQENAAYPSGTCAERTACYYASAHLPGMPMKKIAIAAWTRLHQPETATDEECFQAEPISPCGACRQALLEYEAKFGPIEVILYGRNRIYRLPSVASLMPLSFTEF